jgi:hypothetical protein
MILDDVIAALGIPVNAMVNQRVPKTLMVKNGAPAAADKRLINEGIESVQWLAALKATTIGVPEYRDDAREYLEIAVLRADLRTGANANRLAELIHRAIPYPVFLVTKQDDNDDFSLSLAHMRWSLAQASETVIDGNMIIVKGLAGIREDISQAFFKELALLAQPRGSLYALYQGWIDTLLALEAARITGVFRTNGGKKDREERREALQACAQLEVQIKHLRAAARIEKQVAKLVSLNLELKELEAQLERARQKL